MDFDFRAAKRAAGAADAFWSPFFAAAAFLLPGLIALPAVSNDLPDAAGLPLAWAALGNGTLPFPGHALYLLLLKLAWTLSPAGLNFWFLRSVNPVLVSAASGILYLTARRAGFSPLIGLVGALMFALAPSVLPPSLHLSTGSIALFGLASLGWLLLKGLRSAPPHPLTALSGGLLAGLAVNTDPSLVLPAAVLAAWLIGTGALPAWRPAAGGMALLGFSLGLSAPWIWLLWKPSAGPLIRAIPQPDHWLAFLSDGLVQGFSDAAGRVKALGDFLHGSPFFSMVFIGFGAAQNLWGMLLAAPRSKRQDQDRVRPAIFLLGLSAAGAWLLWGPGAGRVLAGLSLAGVFWCWPALQYALTELGHPEDQARQAFPKPTVFGLLIVSLVPLLAWMHSQPFLRPPRPNPAAISTAKEAVRHLCSILPEDSGLMVLPEDEPYWSLARRAGLFGPHPRLAIAPSAAEPSRSRLRPPGDFPWFLLASAEQAQRLTTSWPDADLNPLLSVLWPDPAQRWTLWRLDSRPASRP